MRIHEFIIESAHVKFPITPELLEKAKQTEWGYIYWANVVPQPIASQRNLLVNRSLLPLLKAGACKFDMQNMFSESDQTLYVTADIKSPVYPADDKDPVEGLQILECDYDIKISSNGLIQHTIGVNAGYSGHTAKGFVTSLIGQIYTSLETLHGPGQRTLAINDDKGAGIWQNIMGKLHAVEET
jgi:hypothetical protein